jgi:hypothetical protein
VIQEQELRLVAQKMCGWWPLLLDSEMGERNSVLLLRTVSTFPSHLFVVTLVHENLSLLVCDTMFTSQ